MDRLTDPPAPSLTPDRFAAASDASWPAAETVIHDGWHLRFTEGAGSRASSVWTAEHAPADLDAAIAGAEAAYTARGLVPRFQLWPGDEALDAALEARGYLRYDRSALMVRPLTAPWPAPEKDCVAVEVRCPLAALDALWASGGVGAERRAVLARAKGPKALFLGRVGMAPAGAVAVVVDRDVAVTQALWVEPAFRGKGLARCLMGAAGAAAARHGASMIAHAVLEENAVAIRLYEALGFHRFGAYHYRRSA